MAVEIRRGSDRFAEREVGRRTLHAFSFGARYDADHVRFGPMVCHDEHLLGRGRGFEPHEHAGLVIVSHVLSGALEHTGPDGSGGSVVLEAGQTGLFRTGSSVTHAEVAAAPQTRFVQVWLAPDDPAALPGEPSYDVVATPVEPLPGARFEVVTLDDGDTFRTPVAPRVHVFVGRGALLRSSLAEPLHDGDAFLFTDEPAHDLVAGVPTTLLVWTFI
ncbi:pirin family protein [Nocardioides flavescens]|uniref:Pirin N-terminal domain-containing protein n=1 Tax=Nocardioides flavescens TaxID=2691959 RepID=A0A6L7EWY1_9ACTN|nr:hypothetical protein [Nocardioides flavescens]